MIDLKGQYDERIDLKKDDFYHTKKQQLWNMYWKENDGSDIFRPNGFSEYPAEVYDVFLGLVDHDGRVIDLGCGNGLMLRHLTTRSKHKLIPYGVDFIEESIKQAKEVVLPLHAENFIVENIVDIDLGVSSFDFIFFDPFHVHSDGMQGVIDNLLKACKPGGKIVFYSYKDVLKVLKLLNFFKLKWVNWVGDLLPQEIAKKLKRIGNKQVSVGVYET